MIYGFNSHIYLYAFDQYSPIIMKFQPQRTLIQSGIGFLIGI